MGLGGGGAVQVAGAGMRWKGGAVTPPPSRAPSLRPANVSLTPSTGFNSICNRQ